MKHRKIDITVLLLMLVITVGTVISVIMLKAKGLKSTQTGCEEAISLNGVVITSLYTMNVFQMSYLQDFVVDNDDGERLLFRKVVKQPSYVLFLSEDFCPICIETLMEEYSLSASDVPLFVIFNNIPQRELKFRNNVFDNATCFSMPADNLFYENLRISQLLLYLSEDMYIEGVLAPFNGIKKDAYETFFTKKSLTSRVI